MFSHCCFVPAYLIALRKSHPKKGPHSILFTLLPIVTEVREEQDPKASDPIYLTLLGIITDFRDLQYSNVRLPMLATRFPKEIEVNE